MPFVGTLAEFTMTQEDNEEVAPGAFVGNHSLDQSGRPTMPHSVNCLDLMDGSPATDFRRAVNRSAA
jgi:hypothetical protein